MCLNVFSLEEKMTADNAIEIKEAFQRSQKGHNNKAKLVASLKSRYNKVCAGRLRWGQFDMSYCLLLFIMLLNTISTHC